MHHLPTGWRWVPLVALAALVFSGGIPAVALADTVSGSGTLFIGEPRTCESPIDACSRSRLTGVVKRYKFVGQTGGLADDDPNTIVVHGNSVIRMRGGGRLFSDDVVRINNVTGDVLHHWNITGGTGPYQGCTGSMAAGGNLVNAGAGIPYSIVVFEPDP